MARAPLICPKCQGEMVTRERDGVLIDECRSCGGLFLDRGEIDRLIEAENLAEPEETEGRPRAHAAQRRARASSAIADILVLMAAEPQHAHRRPSEPPASRAPDADAT
ncbi:MAG TPA: zf-TFIIB domain-containing protein [Solirubrobacteraceae bacterium]|nr:zf-TFIIB domain-containing protein [Solirubrobacteraceae bacterium]